MAITGIGSNYNNVYQNTYTEQKQETAKKKEVKETTSTQKNVSTENTTDYISKLAKFVPSAEFRIGNDFSTAKTGITLTVSPKLLEKMQNDPETEKEMKELIKGVEAKNKLVENWDKMTGRTTVFCHDWIDENGKFHSFSQSKREDKLNKKLREEAQENAEKLIEKTKEKAAEKKKELQETLEEKKETKTEEKSALSQAEQLINEKIAASKDGIILFDDDDMQTFIEAAKEEETAQLAKKSAGKDVEGTNFDMKI